MNIPRRTDIDRVSIRLFSMRKVLEYEQAVNAAALSDEERLKAFIKVQQCEASCIALERDLELLKRTPSTFLDKETAFDRAALAMDTVALESGIHVRDEILAKMLSAALKELSNGQGH